MKNAVNDIPPLEFCKNYLSYNHATIATTKIFKNYSITQIFICLTRLSNRCGMMVHKSHKTTTAGASAQKDKQTKENWLSFVDRSNDLTRMMTRVVKYTIFNNQSNRIKIQVEKVTTTKMDPYHISATNYLTEILQVILNPMYSYVIQCRWYSTMC